MRRAIVPACQLLFYIISYQYVIIRTQGKRVSGGKERPGEKSHGGKECLGEKSVWGKTVSRGKDFRGI